MTAPVLRIEHLDTPWCVPSVHRAPRAGGWASVGALQQANYLRCWHPPRVLPGVGFHVERATPLPVGVLLERFDHDADLWRPYVRLEITP